MTASTSNRSRRCKNCLAVHPNAVDGAQPIKKSVAPKAAVKKAAPKPKPEEIIVISPDPEEVVEKEKQQHINKGEKSLKKRAPTLTSTLSVRSKAACGVVNRPKEQKVDIDAADANYHLAVVEYIDEIYNFYKLAEEERRKNKLRLMMIYAAIYPKFHIHH